jgi:hypothetical protein
MCAPGDDKEKEKSESDMERLFSKAFRELEKVEGRRRKDVESLDGLWHAIGKIEKALEDQSGPAAPRRTRKPRGTAPAGQAAPTANGFRVDGVEHGKVIVTFGDARQVKLTPALHALVEILAADDGNSPDELVGFKTSQQLAARLHDRLKRKFSRHAVSQLLWRLRKSLEAASWDARLLESAPKSGARLRVKRGAAAVGGAM